MSSLAFNFQRNVTSKGKTRLHARPSTIEKDLMYEHSAPIGSETEPKIQVCTTLFTLTPQLLQIVPQILIPPHRLQMTRQRSSQPSHMQEIDGAKPTGSTETASLAATVCPFGRNFGIRGFELVSAAWKHRERREAADEVAELVELEEEFMIRPDCGVCVSLACRSTLEKRRGEECIAGSLAAINAGDGEPRGSGPRLSQTPYTVWP